MSEYGVDLAHVHDSGYSKFADNASLMIVDTLHKNGINKGLVVDLGCGSGIVAKVLCENRFEVFGIDYSAALIDIARKKAPHAKFQVGSFFDVPLPDCSAVISTSECLNYLFDEKNNEELLKQLFQRVYASLKSGGLFIFDLIEPGIVGGQKSIVEKEDWTMFVHTYEDLQTNLLKRDITLFRKIGDTYRKSKEIHTVRLYNHGRVMALLKEVGFEVGLFKNYADVVLKDHHFGFLCRKA